MRVDTGSRYVRHNEAFNVKLAIDKLRIREWCQKNQAILPKVPATMWTPHNHGLLWPNSNVSGLCGEEWDLVPAMARHACIAGTWDPLLYQTCLKDAWLPNMCNAQFIFCSYANSHLEGQAIVVLTYMLIPSAALLLMLVILSWCWFLATSVPHRHRKT